VFIGWAKRIYDVTLDFVSSDEEGLREVKGVGPKTAEKIFAEREKNIKSLKHGKWEGLVDVSESLQQTIIRDKGVGIKDADKMVTVDTSRLIRLPDTLHGGSSLKAASVKNPESFNPLVDAVVFSDEPVKIKFSKNVPVFEIMEQNYGPYRNGMEVKVPEYAGVYLLVKDAAEIV